ncbi:MAG: hypothetical protein ACOC9Y_02905 [Chloroflexota bacterium]
MIKIQFRRKPAPPIESQLKRPKHVGAYRYTLRSAPRHHDEIREVIERRGGSRVYFSEPLAYLRGQGISLFRVESREVDFLEDLYAWWAQKERDEAFPFDINLFFNDREWVASLREHTPDEIKKIIEEGAPRTTEEDLLPHYQRPQHN